MAASGNYIVESDIDNWETSVAHTEDILPAAVNITTNVLTVVHDIATCTEIKMTSTEELPAPLEDSTVYYAIRIAATQIKLAMTPVLAAAGTAIDLTSIGSGVHTVDIGSGESETKRQEIIDRIEAMIELITKDLFYSKDFILYYNGSGKNRIDLNLNPDILTITEIQISGVVLPESWYAYDKNSIYLDPSNADDDISNLAELLLRLKTKALFPLGMNNIKITGTYGWTSCPSAIKKAAVILCSYENDSTLYTAYENLSSDSLGDHSYNRGDRKFLTGIHEADRLLLPYIRRKIILGSH